MDISSSRYADIKGIQFLLCTIDIYSTYASVVSLNDKNRHYNH